MEWSMKEVLMMKTVNTFKPFEVRLTSIYKP